MKIIKIAQKHILCVKESAESEKKPLHPKFKRRKGRFVLIKIDHPSRTFCPLGRLGFTRHTSVDRDQNLHSRFFDSRDLKQLLRRVILFLVDYLFGF